MMKFGVCTAPEGVPAAAAAGFDYVEWTVGGLLQPEASRDDFLRTLDGVLGAALPCPAVNCFIPGSLKITGPDVDSAALELYALTALERAREAAVTVIVFGSGGARKVPEGFDHARALDQLAAFCRTIAPVARANGVTVVLEPLNRNECNILNTVGECAELVRAVDDPAIRLLADAYHMLLDGDDNDTVAANGDILRHTHIATAPARLAPGAEPCDFAPFFRALAAAGYEGGLSIEGKIPDPAADLPAALSLMRSLAADAAAAAAATA